VLREKVPKKENLARKGASREQAKGDRPDQTQKEVYTKWGQKKKKGKTLANVGPLKEIG